MLYSYEDHKSDYKAAQSDIKSDGGTTKNFSGLKIGQVVIIVSKAMKSGL